MKPKENAMQDFLAFTRKSWTYERMTYPEKAACENALSSPAAHDIQGTYRQRVNAYNAIYFAYLLGIGYNGPLWREPHPEEIPFVPGGDTL